MTTDTPIPANDPLMLAWTAHKATDEYANSRQWAAHPEHLEGSLWALFMAGWKAALAAAPTPQAGEPVAAPKSNETNGLGAKSGEQVAAPPVDMPAAGMDMDELTNVKFGGEMAGCGIVITSHTDGRILAVSEIDDEGRIVKVLAESPAPTPQAWEAVRTVRFPRAVLPTGGWVIDPAFIRRVLHSIDPDTEAEFTPSGEEIETTLLALEVIPKNLYAHPAPTQQGANAQRIPENCGSGHCSCIECLKPDNWQQEADARDTSAAFDAWWDAGNLMKDNPYNEGTPAFWAWEGWWAAKGEQK